MQSKSNHSDMFEDTDSPDTDAQNTHTHSWRGLQQKSPSKQLFVSLGYETYVSGVLHWSIQLSLLDALFIGPMSSKQVVSHSFLFLLSADTLMQQ
ncbi:hypothetical protein FKM82_023440 [Ascaphus truei]